MMDNVFAPVCVDYITQLCDNKLDTLEAFCSDDSGNGNICYNNTEICAARYYCPMKSIIRECRPGYYCPEGSVSPQRCTLGAISCPRPLMEYPEPGIMFGGLFILFISWLLLHSYIAKMILQNQERNLTDATTEESRLLSQHQEGVQYKKTLIALGEQFGERPNMKTSHRMAHSSGNLSIRTINGYKRNSRAASKRARANWKRIISSRTFRDYVKMMRDRERNLVNTVTGSFEFNKLDNPLTIAFDHLDLKLKSNGMSVLKDIFGCFRPFNITALMGSSGAGKTTLLTLLRGKAHFADTSGEIRVNGVLTPSLVPFTDVMAYVPQDDIMYDDLTVSENLRYSCLLFNRRGFTKSKDIVPMVHHVMELLALSLIKHSVVGSPDMKGISGGQKKRVSIGMELMKEPSLFFLDEPTSGLDSASSISLVNSLRKISQNGVNIVATLHQPRTEIFDLIHMLYLLAQGGRVAYFGPAFGLNNHLRKLGFTCPPSSNISDYVMDVISGFVPPAWNADATVQETVAQICNYTYAEFHEKCQKAMRQFTRGVGETVAPSRALKKKTFVDRLRQQLSLLCHTFLLCLRREMKIYYRTMITTIMPYLVLIGMGALIGNLFGSVTLSSKTLPSQVMSAQLAYVITIQPAAMKLFYLDTLVRTRESDGGVALIPLYFGKLVGRIIEFCVLPMAFTCGYYPFIEALAGIGEYYYIFLLLTFAATGLVNLCVVLFAKKSGTISNGLLIILWAVGGIEPNVSVIFERLGGFGKFLVSISMFRKSFEMGLLVELRRYTDVYASSVALMYDEYDIRNSKYKWDVVYLIFYWVITNILAVLCMVWQRDNCRYWRMFLEVYFWPSVDHLLTSDSFVAWETWVTHVRDAVNSVDAKISLCFLRIGQCFVNPEEPENVECDLFLQDLLAQPENTLETLCKKCSRPIQQHKRQSAQSVNWSLSAKAKQRRNNNSSFMSNRDMNQIFVKTFDSGSVSSMPTMSSYYGLGSERLFVVEDNEDEMDDEGDMELGVRKEEW